MTAAVRDFHSKLTSCSALAEAIYGSSCKAENEISNVVNYESLRLSQHGWPCIHAVKVEDFHSKLTSCLACRLAGRMAIHAVKVEDFHSKNREVTLSVTDFRRRQNHGI